MYFVIAGAGEVGYHVARTLREEGHAIALIEADPGALRRVEGLDALLVQGSGASLDRLQEADIQDADVFIGVTAHDEVNMMGAVVAKSFGAKTIARINNPQYLTEAASARYRNIGVDVALCPELVAADKVARTLDAPNLLSVDVFAESRVHVGELRVEPSAAAVGRKVKDLDLPLDVNLVAVNRAGESLVARGEVTIEANDRILVAMKRPEAIMDLEGVLGRRQAVSTARKVENVMIAGATRIGMHLARILEKHRNVVLVDEDEARCKRATEELDRTLIINGNATDRRVLRDEDVETMDAFIGTHQVEEYNILACLLARDMGVKKTVALINQPELRDLVESIGIDLAVNPKQATVGTVLRHVYQADAVDLVLTREGDAQLIEIRVHDDSRVAGKSLKNANFPRGAVCAAIVRGEEVILPRGTDLFLPGDRVVIFARPEEVPRVERLF